MATVALSVLLSFALILSTQPVAAHEEKITEMENSELGPAQVSLEEAAVESGEIISSDELKKIGSEIKEAFQKIGDAVSDALSPGQGEFSVQSFLEGVTSGMESEAGKENGEADKEKESSEEAEEGASSSGEGDADGPSSEKEASSPSGDGGAPSSEDGKEASSPSEEGDAPSPGNASSPKE